MAGLERHSSHSTASRRIPSWPIPSETPAPVRRSFSAREPATVSASRSTTALTHTLSKTLYNGMSNRERGWKSRTLSETNLSVMEPTMVPHAVNVKRWDGAARACTPWDGLKRDPELWYRNGNCYIHLYSKGQSQRGPAFKVPFDSLIAARCHPLIERYLVLDVPESPTSSTVTPQLGQEYFDFYSHRASNSPAHGAVELYMPPPAGASKEEALAHHLATRNFFAWMFNRSVVGEFLGVALIELMRCMESWRCKGEDNVGDLMRYLDEEGYLNVVNQPVHAVAVLNLGEHYRVRELFVDAFTHCVGMEEMVRGVAEWQIISPETRKLLKTSAIDMNLQLSHAGVMLRNFLEDDLSEAHIGLTAAGRQHLGRFRSFLLDFFDRRLGGYPPAPTSIDTSSMVFAPEVYRTMHADLESLYAYLVDESFAAGESSSSPLLAQGGICTLQSVHGFDLRNRFSSLPHPLPLLPEIHGPLSTASHSGAMITGNTDKPPHTPSNTASRRLSWLPGRVSTMTDKLRPDARLVTHAALMKATNSSRAELLRNDLVAAYRRFEEDTVFSPSKHDRPERNGLSHVDARKIRWILVYAVYQVVRACASPPAECRDVSGARYNVCVDVGLLPAWRERAGRSVPARSANAMMPRWCHPRHSYAPGRFGPVGGMNMSTTALPSANQGNASWSSLQSTPSGYEAAVIRPDVEFDYFSAARPQTGTGLGGRPGSRTSVVTPGGGGRLSLNGGIKRSLSGIFAGFPMHGQISDASRQKAEEKEKASRARRQSYHEILVHGYGNGTNSVRPVVQVNTAKARAVSQPQLGSKSAPVTPADAVAPRSAGFGNESLSATTASQRSPSASLSSTYTSAGTDLGEAHSPATEYTAAEGWGPGGSRRSSANLEGMGVARRDFSGSSDTPPSLPPLPKQMPLTPMPSLRSSTNRANSTDTITTATVTKMPRPLTYTTLLSSKPILSPPLLIERKPVPPPVLTTIQKLRSYTSLLSDDDSPSEYTSTSTSPPALPRRNSRRNSRDLQPSPLRIRKVGALESKAVEEMEEPEDVYDEQGFLVTKEGDADAVLEGVIQDMWEQFAHVGGLTEPGPSLNPYTVVENEREILGWAGGTQGRDGISGNIGHSETIGINGNGGRRVNGSRSGTWSGSAIWSGSGQRIGRTKVRSFGV